MNTIGKISFDFRMENEAFARSLYGRWDNFFALHVEKIADSVLQKYEKAGYVVEIDSLDLDLEKIPEEQFDERFPLLLREKLENALLPYLVDNHAAQSAQTTEKEYLFTVLCRFLLHGYLPWNVADKYKNICELFLTVLRGNSKKLKAFLLTYGHYTSLQQRLVYQLDEPSLEKGIYLLAPGESAFICSYIHFLKEKYETLDKSYITRTNYRNAVYLVVYAYLLTNRSSYFNKKSFLVSTIQDLAKKYSLTYNHLLSLLTMQIESLAVKQSIHTELYLILKQLRNELSEILLKKSYSDFKAIYERMTPASDTSRASGEFTADELQVLSVILSNESTCRRFLQPLKETQIIALVRVIVPGNSGFVIGYAKTLDTQQQKGLLEGKAGSEFRLLKWQVIFPVLFENKGVAFNRKYFVRDTLRKIAARYNLHTEEVLRYLCAVPFGLSNELLVVFQQLLDEYTDDESTGKVRNQPVLSVRKIRELIKNDSEIRLTDIESIINLLSVEDSRAKVLQALTEEEHLRLVSMLVPSDSYFIVPYARVLEMQKKHSAIQSVTQGDFSKIKWMFMYSVLFASTRQVFNRKYFVGRTLDKLAAHYNTSVKDLLLLFYENNVLKNIHLPFDLVQVFEELRIDYKLNVRGGKTVEAAGKERGEETLQGSPEKTIQISQAESSKASRRETARKTLEKHFGSDPSLSSIIRRLSDHYDFVAYIDPILQIEYKLQQIISLELNLTGKVDKATILELLLRLSSGYSYLSREEILSRIVRLLVQRMNMRERTLFFARANKLFQSDRKLVSYSEIINLKNNILMNEQILNIPQDEHLYTNNAGVVLIAPYLPRLFSMFSLADRTKFFGENEQLKAIAAMNYVVTGKLGAEGEQYELYKLLVGMDMATPLPALPDLTDEEKETCESMLKGALQNWPKLKNTSLTALREAFLLRSGKLEFKEEIIHLTVEEKAYDMLLDSVPWNFRLIKFQWIEKRIEVKWR